MQRAFRRVKNTISQRSRQQKLDHFYSLYSGGDLIDVGVSKLKLHDASSSSNYFLKHLRVPLERYTGLGVDDLSGLGARYPGARFVTYDGLHMPFADGEFAWAFCNAVVEHVENPLLFVRELARISKNVFMTTPNKYFPVETHSGIVLLHWHSPYLTRWVDRRWPGTRINLFSRDQFRNLLRAAGVEAVIIPNRFCGVTMTFTATLRGRTNATTAE